jgi:hypothetical protein
MTMPFLAQALAPPSILLRSPPSVWLLGLSLPELRRKHWHYHPNASQSFRNQPGSAVDLRYPRQVPTSWQEWRSRTQSPPVKFSSRNSPQDLDRQIIPYGAQRTKAGAVAAPAAAPAAAPIGPATTAPKTPPTAAPPTRLPVVVQAVFATASAITATTAIAFMNPL